MVVSEVKLAVGDDLWCYTGVTTYNMNTEYKEFVEVKRTGSRRYAVRCVGRADSTGWVDYTGTLPAALRKAGFPPNGVVSVLNVKGQNSYRIDFPQCIQTP